MQFLILMVCSHCPKLKPDKGTKLKKWPEPIKWVCNPLASVTVPVSVLVQYEHLHTILYTPFLLVSVFCLSHWHFEDTILVRVSELLE